MSRQVDQLAAMAKSFKKEAMHKDGTAIHGCRVAKASKKKMPPRQYATAPWPVRPKHGPSRRPTASVRNPPNRQAIPPQNSGAPEAMVRAQPSKPSTVL